MATVRSVNRRGGFTLIEVMLVVALLVLLMALAWPAFDKRIYAAQLPESAENVRAALRMARASSSLNARRYRLRWEVETQQPMIEYEVDPVREPGRWDPCSEGWATDPLLLGNVNVVRVVRGRPEYLTPISHTLGEEDEFSLEEEAAAGQDVAGEIEDENSNGEPETTFSLEPDEEEDEDRPRITFDVDGSSDWYTLILARAEPGETLEPTTPQIWIVLDGRTGLPRIQEALTEDQMAELTRRPDLDKLQPPELAQGDLSMTSQLNEGGSGDTLSGGLFGGSETGGGLGDTSGFGSPGGTGGMTNTGGLARGGGGGGTGDTGAGSGTVDPPKSNEDSDASTNNTGTGRRGLNRGGRRGG
ncbi:MAG: prepilin-type N-terminal cleavage/methylation domain-containing protein [Phycisphaerae bacterium]|nr:prepilin-type N-terminal cleavage/methylation domain-containing protein [Phycisphaerae bacterium]NUQ46771.1 prepilin-type N-terminal cleavage/methylation domain-containing protein [Phycisphaerae bacterium]